MRTTSESGKVERLRFGLLEWITLLTVGVAPALGFGSWAIQMNTSVALLKQQSEATAQAVSRLVTNGDALVGIQSNVASLTAQIQNNEKRLDRIETQEARVR